MLKKLSPIEILCINYLSGTFGIISALNSWYIVTSVLWTIFFISFLAIEVRKDIK